MASDLDETLKAGAIASGAICYTISPIHNLESYVKVATQMKALGVQAITIKDMAGIMGPKESYDLVSAIKDAVPELPLVIHTHCTTGLAFMTCLKGVEAGADVLDTAISSFSGGTGFPRITSTSRNTSLPPSRAGTGRRFNIPRFTDSISMIFSMLNSTLCQPYSFAVS